MQGEGSRSELLERFRRLGNAILVASQSFWEGVDVRGEALSLVVIDKLPFAPPDDPVLAARIDNAARSGAQSLHGIPAAARRDQHEAGLGPADPRRDDRGVLMICDPRLTGKPYGKAIWRSLPPMRRTRDIVEVEASSSPLPVKSAHEPAASNSPSASMPTASASRSTAGDWRRSWSASAPASTPR
jgi:ATP-dependent DNA helicase DinG